MRGCSAILIAYEVLTELWSTQCYQLVSAGASTTWQTLPVHNPLHNHSLFCESRKLLILPRLGEFELESEYDDEFELEWEDQVGLISDEEEMELASELLNVSSEEELDQFLGKVFRRVGRRLRRFGRRAKRFFKSGVGLRLGGTLKRLARRALPIAGKAIGGAFGGPVGAAIGGRLAPAAGRSFGLELEGLSPEDQEFETARRFVRLAASAAANAARGSQTTAEPNSIVRSAMVKAARQHAPGLLRPGSLRSGTQSSRDHRGGGSSGGRWIRRGNKIVLLGV